MYKNACLINTISGGNMKKLFLLLIGVMALFTLTGCDSLMNTPTKRVEALLNSYKTEDKKVLEQLDKVLLSETIMDSSLKERYRNLMLRQYRDLTYKIKNETIDGNNATVEVEIMVYDYNSAIKEVEDKVLNDKDYVDESGNVKTTKFNEEKIKRMEETKNRITYTINFTVAKIDNKWVVDDLTETERMKIHGLYA